MTGHINRRTFIKGATVAGTVGVTGLAGCLGDDEGPIPMGSILPITGSLDFLGPDMESAVNLAVDHVNEAGGPLGREIDMINMDSETNDEAGLDRYETLVTEDDIVSFVGAASSGVSAPIAENVADDEVMQISPASTSPVLADVGWSGDLKYFGRTAPNDAQQGIVMAKVLNEYLEADTAAFLYVDNPYGSGLTNVAKENFNGEVVAEVGYDDESTDFTSTLDQVFENDPDVVNWVGYPGEGDSILPQWEEGGYGGQWVYSEGLDSPEWLQNWADLTEGAYITSPEPEETDGIATFQEEHDGGGPFDPHSYDALFIAALAIEEAGEASGPAISENFLDVCNPPGEVVTVGEFEKAKDLIDDGEDIQYEGASSPLVMDDNYETLNQFAIKRVIEGGERETLEVIPSEDF